MSLSVCSLRLIAGDRMHALRDQLLDQLSAGRLVLDHHDISGKSFALLAHRPFQLGILHALAQYVQQVKVLAFDAPAHAHAEIAELAGLVGGVPALHDLIEFLGELVRGMALSG